MRVVHLAPTAFGAGGLYGGGERYPLELARAVASHLDCTLVTFAAAGSDVREAGGLRVRSLPTRRHLHGHPAHPLAPGLLAALAGADVIHAHQLWAVPSRLAAVAGAVRGQGLAVTDHGLLGRRPRPLTHRLVDRFLTVSRHSAEILGVPAGKTTVIYGGVDARRFSPPAPSGAPTPRRAGLLFVGRLTPHKGVDRLLRALPANATLTVVGTAGHDHEPPESGYPASLRRLAEGRDVRFVGGVGDAELVERYRSAVAVVVPSVEVTCYGKPVGISELLGLVALEAMACGTPVVASAVGGLGEVVSHGETGWLVPPGDDEELGRRLAQVVAEPGEARRVGDNARQAVAERFTWDACARRCLEAYHTIAR